MYMYMSIYVYIYIYLIIYIYIFPIGYSLSLRYIRMVEVGWGLLDPDEHSCSAQCFR